MLDQEEAFTIVAQASPWTDGPGKAERRKCYGRPYCGPEASSLEALQLGSPPVVGKRGLFGTGQNLGFDSLQFCEAIWLFGYTSLRDLPYQDKIYH